MNESNKLPQAISHKKLSFLLLNAQKDKFANSEESIVPKTPVDPNIIPL